MKKIYSLNQEWRFKKSSELYKVELDDYFNMFASDTKTGIRSDYLGDSWYDDEWEKVSLPHDWTVCELPNQSSNQSQGYRPVGEVVYRKSFTLDDELSSKRLFLKFDAIAIKSKIYVNGILVAHEECGYTPTFTEITDFIEPGKQIVIAVVADNRIKEGWWYEGGGIYGNVYLISAEASMFANDGIYVSPELLNNDRWCVNITVEIDGDYQNLKAVFNLNEITAECTFNDKNQGSAQILVENPALWSCDSPSLYKMKCLLYNGDELIDKEEISFGFRNVTFDTQNGCLLNGKPIKLKGVCLHHDHAGVGVAIPYKLHRYRLERLKEMGVNAIRTSHNPQLDGFYKACDELGFLVMNETRHFSSTEECLGQLRKFVRRDRNHPCVVMWSLFNEEPLQCTKIGYKMAEKMKKTLLKEDNSRPVTGGMNGPLEPEGVVNAVDIMGFNYLQYGYEPFHEVYPEIPIIGSETGSYLSTRYTAHTDKENAKRCSFENELGVNRYAWSATPGDTWKNIEDKCYVLGGFYWTGFDYRGECGSFPSVVSSFGAMDLCGFPKECFYMHKAVWDEKKHINTVYYLDYKKPGDILVNCYTNCETVTLYIDGKYYREYKSVKYEPLSVYIEDFHGKEFNAVGKINGNIACSECTQLPVAPYYISARLSKDTLLSDGEDICVIDVYLTGANGNVLHTSDNLVEFNVNGGGRIIGVGNGDNSDITSDKANCKKLYHGCCQLILQSNGKREDTQIQIICDGIGEKTYNLTSVFAQMLPQINSEASKLSVLSWRASDVLKEYPHNNIADLMFCWIPTTVGYGKNLMYSGNKGFGAIVGKITVPHIQNNKNVSLVLKEICGDFDIYFDHELIYTSNTSCNNLKIPIEISKYEKGLIITVVFRLNGEDCGITGNAYVEIL